MFKLILLFNLKKLIINKRMERLYFVEKQYKELEVNLKTLTKKIAKLKEAKQTDKIVVELSKLEADFGRAEQIQQTFKQFKMEEEYFEGLFKTIVKNFFK